MMYDLGFSWRERMHGIPGIIHPKSQITHPFIPISFYLCILLQSYYDC